METNSSNQLLLSRTDTMAVTLYFNNELCVIPTTNTIFSLIVMLETIMGCIAACMFITKNKMFILSSTIPIFTTLLQIFVSDPSQICFKWTNNKLVQSRNPLIFILDKNKGKAQSLSRTKNRTMKNLDMKNKMCACLLTKTQSQNPNTKKSYKKYSFWQLTCSF